MVGCRGIAVVPGTTAECSTTPRSVPDSAKGRDRAIAVACAAKSKEKNACGYLVVGPAAHAAHTRVHALPLHVIGSSVPDIA
eukprot:3940652-Rhodomonas_salina.2